MRLRLQKAISFTVFIAAIVGLHASQVSATSPATSPAFPQPGSSSPVQQQFDHCLKIAQQGKIKTAFETAQGINRNFASQRLISVNYINTLLTIIDEKDTKHDIAMINEVIKVVNEEKSKSRYNGVMDAESGYHFMVALGRLSAATMDVNEPISAVIRLLEGEIASNLKSNPAYPKNAVEALAAPLFSMAQGYAIRNNQTAAFASLTKAVDAGFGDFEAILKDPILARLSNDAAIEELVGDLEVRYQAVVDAWSRDVVAKFQRFPLQFNLADIEGGRISNADFGGKVIVLDMWATWCAPCRDGIPHFIKLQNRHRDNGVAVLGVSMDDADEPFSTIGTVKKFVSENSFNYPCAMGDRSFEKLIPGKSILPTTVFIDQDQNVRYIASGYHDYAKIEAITRVLANEIQPVRTGMPSTSN